MKIKRNQEFTKKSVTSDEFQNPKKWFEEVVSGPSEFPKISEQETTALKNEAQQCHNSETANYNIKNSKGNSNFQWMKTIMTKGTLPDRIAALTVTIQNDPIHTLEVLCNFVGMVKVAKKKECVDSIETLTDLFLEDLLKPNMKLQAFHQKPLSLINELSSGNAISRRKILSTWYFEDQLKEIFGTFVDSLNHAAHDSIDANKEKAITAMYKLLAGNPEQEKKLLSFIVNKLGDPSQKVASKSIYCLGQLLRTHSNMQSVVLNEIEKLLFRPNVSTKAQYYALCFISQFYLSHEESDVAKRLIEIYFGFFKACVKKGEIDSRMMSALLMGVNRAYPYAKVEMNKISDHIDTIYRVVHISNFNVSLHALNLLYQVSDFANNVTDRFYSALYKKLLDPHVATTTHQAMLLSLIYKALLKDTEINRVKALVKRLLQLCLHLSPSFSCGVLYLVSQIISKKKAVHSILQKQTSSVKFEEEDDEEEKYKDLETTVKEEILSDEEDHAQSDGLPQLSENNSVVIENEDEKPDIKKEMENFDTNGPGWFHRNLNDKKDKKQAGTYDPFSRNPLYSGAEFTALLELNYLRQHFHPTVSLYASNILNGETIKYQGDPLKDFTLIRFLDRFVFKNPKKTEEFNKGSHPTFGQRKRYQPKGAKSLSVMSNNYIHSGADNIPVDEKFLYFYLNKKYSSRAVDEENDDSDVDSVASDEFEEMLEKMGGPPKDIDDDLDFMNDIGDSIKNDKSKKKGKKGDKEDSDEDDASSEDDDENESELEDDDAADLEMEDDDEELIGDLDEDDDEEDILFEDEDEDDGKQLSKKSNKSKKKKKGFESLFASADEFATLLEDEGSSKKKPGSSNAFSNKDKADSKQIDWEEKRNIWLSGYDKAMGKKKQYPRGNKRPQNFKQSRNVKKSRQ